MSSVRSAPPEIDGLTFQRPIGGGGFADVFLYRQHSTNRDVAVKVLRAEHLSDAGLRQFRTEADVMARVSTHPFIVTVLDAGVATDGRPHIVMEYYSGPHFGTRARGRELGVPEILRVGIQVASAVETAHRAGILHRDIKPANILTSEYGNPGLTDFGVAAVQSEAAMSAADGFSVGFTAPEVLLDESTPGSRSSDVYALGATIYALLAGRSPVWFPGGSNDHGTLLHRAATGEIGALDGNTVPRQLELLVRQCLEPDPALRPTAAVDLARSLQEIEQSLTLTPTPLALVGTTDPVVARRREDDDDATRRRPRVVDPDAGVPTGRPVVGRGGTVGVPPAPATGPGGGPPVGTPVHPPLPTGSPAVGSDIEHAHTVLRAPVGTTVDPEPATGSGDGRPRWLLPAAGAAVAVVLLGIVAVLTGTGSGEQATPPTTTLLTRSEGEEPFIATIVGEPTGFTASRTGDGSIELTWQPPAKPSVAPEAFTYDLYLDGDHELMVDIDDVSVTLEEDDLGDGPVCFDLYAALDDSISISPSRACLGDGDDSSVPDGADP